MSAAASVRLGSGLIAGEVTWRDVRAYRGIPYAAAPIGLLRWRPPTPVMPWDGVRPATRFGPRSVQVDRASDSVGYFGPESASEDCLYLNVWTGAQSAADRLPVLVWLHGGAFEVGSGALPIFEGSTLAREGLIVVTVNYRLGRLGFLAHPALSAENRERASGNYGLMDQIAALRWVHDNIAAFGGDPDRVTLAGQSAGAISTCALMAAPEAVGLFHRAILHSGGAVGPVRSTAGLGDTMSDLQSAERAGEQFAFTFRARTSDELRALPVWDLQTACADGHVPSQPLPRSPGRFDTAWPILDGRLLPVAVPEVFSAGQQAAVPVIVGNTGQEWATMPARADRASLVKAEARGLFGAHYEEFAALFPHDTDAQARTVSQQMTGYRTFYWQGLQVGRLHAAAATAGVWHYRFDHRPPVPAGRTFREGAGAELGAFHGAELPYVFGTLGVRDWCWAETDHRLSSMMRERWIRFAETGNPNPLSSPEPDQWPQFTANEPVSLHITESVRAVRTPDLDRIILWDQIYQ